MLSRIHKNYHKMKMDGPYVFFDTTLCALTKQGVDAYIMDVASPRSMPTAPLPLATNSQSVALGSVCLCICIS